MQHSADFITADFLYMFRASVFYTPDDVRLTPETCRESLQ